MKKLYSQFLIELRSLLTQHIQSLWEANFDSTGHVYVRVDGRNYWYQYNGFRPPDDCPSSSWGGYDRTELKKAKELAKQRWG